jgi:hypothetical protein
LYRPSYLYAWRTVFDSEHFAETMCEIVESQLHIFFDSLAHTTPLELHRANLIEGRKWWSSIRTNLTCLMCLCCSPEHGLSCGHSLCDKCVQLWGRGQPGSHNMYRIDGCLLCRATCTKLVQLKPPSASIRILSIDGGGIKGIIPLKEMEEMQVILGPDLRIQDLFDLVFGTSSGLFTCPRRCGFDVSLTIPQEESSI